MLIHWRIYNSNTTNQHSENQSEALQRVLLPRFQLCQVTLSGCSGCGPTYTGPQGKLRGAGADERPRAKWLKFWWNDTQNGCHMMPSKLCISILFILFPICEAERNEECLEVESHQIQPQWRIVSPQQIHHVGLLENSALQRFSNIMCPLKMANL